MSGCIAVINAGSSSIKFAIFEASGKADTLFHGQIEGIGVSPHLKVRDARGGTLVERTWPAAGVLAMRLQPLVKRTSNLATVA
jgi:acetate kinase